MTTIIFLLLIFGLFMIGLNLLPEAGILNPSISGGFEFIIGQMKAWNFMFPISELFVIVSLFATLELGILGFKFFKWGMHYLRGTTH